MSNPDSESDVVYRATAGYLPLHDGEIELCSGDILTNVKDLYNGWTLGRNVSRDSVGIFPSDYVIPALDITTPELERQPGLQRRCSRKSTELLISPTDTPGKKKDKSPVIDPRDPSRPVVEFPHHYEQLKAAKKAATGINGPLAIGTPITPQQNSIKPDEPNTEFPPPELDDYSSNSLPSPKKQVYQKNNINNRKPQMFVRPNPGKNIFRQTSDTTVKSTSETDLHNSPSCQRRSSSNTPPSVRSTPTQQRIRISAPPGQLISMLPNEEPGDNPEQRSDGQLPSTSGNPGQIQVQSNPLVAEEALTPSDASSPMTPSMEATQQQNMTNEMANRASPHQKQKFTHMKGTFYQDYRTLECPAVDGPPQLRYKPILKNKNGQYNRANEIYYREDPEQQKSTRLILSVLAGIFCAFILFLWMCFALEYSFMISLLTAVITGILLILAFATSRLCRSVGALVVPSLCTTRGRIAFLIIITGFLLDGPVTNIYFNMAEVSRSMSCSAEQSYNQSMLLLQPFDTMMSNLNTTVIRLQMAAHDVSDELRPLRKGLNDAEIGLWDGKLALQGTYQTCRSMVDRAFNDCSAGIADAQNQCLGVVMALGDVYHKARDVIDQLNPEFWAPKHISLQKRQAQGESTLASIPENKRDVCEPLDTLTVCNALNDSEVLCQPAGWAGEAIYDAINATQQAMRELHTTLRFQITPEPYYNARVNASKTLYQVRKKVQVEFYRRTLYFEFVISILKKILPAAILILIYVAYLHVKNYVSKDTYDNVYVTPQFKSLDSKRSEVAGESLLPLKKYERNYLIDTTLSELSPPEDGLYRIGLFVLILHFLIAFLCYLFDYILYWILALIRKHGDPRYDFTGRDSMEYVITGEGVIADLLHVFLKGFHPANLFGYTLDTHVCLPKPTPPSIIILLVVFMLYFGLILTILLKAYILRFRNRVTAYFYPDREKARIVHLYNVVLNHRYRMPKLLQQKAKINHRERQMQEQISVCHRMAVKMPPCRVFVYKQARCLVCQGIEDPTFRDCQTEKCNGAFCAECYDDLGRICPLCHQASEYSDDEDYEELEDDLQPYCRSSKIYV